MLHSPGTTNFVVTITYDQHRGRLHRSGSHGDVIRVLYSASRPSLVVEGRAGETFSI